MLTPEMADRVFQRIQSMMPPKMGAHVYAELHLMAKDEAIASGLVECRLVGTQQQGRPTVAAGSPDAVVIGADAARLADALAQFEQAAGVSVEDYVCGQAFLNSAGQAGGDFQMQLSGLACQMLAASFAGQFKGSGATNYLEMGMTHEELGPFTVTMQRRDGKTPAQFRAEAEAERDALRAQLATSSQMTTVSAGEQLVEPRTKSTSGSEGRTSR